jgi:DNA-binding transcriptional LysR family regulator
MYSARLKLDANLLMVFIAVAEIGRISEASKQLHLSQPAVTAQIRKLEEALRTPLFLRSVRGVSLTAAGRKLLDYARQVRRLVEEASDQVATHREALSGALTIAASTTVAGHVLPQVLTAFHQLHPQVAILVEVGNTDDVLGRVREGRVPLGLVEGHRRAARLRLEPFVQDEIVPVVGTAIADKLLLQRVNKAQRLEDLLALPIIWREPGSGTRAVVEAAFEKAGLIRRAAPDLVLGTTQAIRSAAVCGLGVAFLSRWCMGSELALGKLRVLDIPGLKITRAFHWALPAGGVGAVAGRFLEFARRSPPTLNGASRHQGN